MNREELALAMDLEIIGTRLKSVMEKSLQNVYAFDEDIRDISKENSTKLTTLMTTTYHKNKKSDSMFNRVELMAARNAAYPELDMYKGYVLVRVEGDMMGAFLWTLCVGPLKAPSRVHVEFEWSKQSEMHGYNPAIHRHLGTGNFKISKRDPWFGKVIADASF